MRIVIELSTIKQVWCHRRKLTVNHSAGGGGNQLCGKYSVRHLNYVNLFTPQNSLTRNLLLLSLSTKVKSFTSAPIQVLHGWVCLALKILFPWYHTASWRISVMCCPVLKPKKYSDTFLTSFATSPHHCFLLHGQWNRFHPF